MNIVGERGKKSFEIDRIKELKARKNTLLAVLETIRNPFKLIHSSLVFGRVSLQDINKEIEDIDAELRKLVADK